MENKNLYRARLTIALIVGALSIAAFGGLFYGVKVFDLQFAPLLQRVFVDFSLTALLLLALLLIATLLFGRVYCSTLCPLGLLQELVGAIKKRPCKAQKNYPAKYFIAALAFGALAGGSVLLLRAGDPYTLFGAAFTASAVGIAAVAAVLVLVVFKDRFFCTNICPVGAVLGLLAKIAPAKIYIERAACITCGACAKVCPSGCIDYKQKTVDNEPCVKCLKCLAVCPKNALKYSAAAKQSAPQSVDAKKRKLLISAGVVAAFAVAAKAGNIIKKTLEQKYSDVILPPGAISEERFLNKCLNCNLCVKVCPERIIKKADGQYGAVSLDYSKNFCRYDCNKCCAACPAGALKRMSVEEKQKLRVAMIEPPAEMFEGYAACAAACPTSALAVKDGKPAFVPLKCIGCGACAAASKGRIKIYGANLQRVI